MCEECTFRRPPNHIPGLVDHTLRVEFMDNQGGSVMSWISFHCHADHEVAAFLIKHPRWSHDPTPLVLGIIQQIVWKIKILEIPMGKIYEHERIGVKDTNTGGFIYIDIKACIIDETKLQNWLLPVVNFANTHIVYQIKSFYDNHSCLIPDNSSINTLISEYMRKEDIRHQFDKSSQIANRANFLPASVGFSAFLDESGNSGFSDTMSHYTVVAVIVRQDKESSLRDSIRRALFTVWGRNSPAEIHYNSVPNSKKQTVRIEFAKIVQQHDAMVLCFSVLKLNYLKYLLRCHAESRPQEKYPIDIDLNDYLTDPTTNMQYGFLSLLQEELVSHICIDNLKKGCSVTFNHDKKRNEWMNRALQSGFNNALNNVDRFSQSFFGEKLSFPSQLLLPHSVDEPILWIADWIANEVGKWPHGSELSAELLGLGDNFQVIGYDNSGVKRITRVLGEPSLDEFPEIPRNINKLARDIEWSP